VDKNILPYGNKNATALYLENGQHTQSPVLLLARVRLQGALLGSPDGRMRDNLRTQGVLPTSEPYTALSGLTHVNNITEEKMVNLATVFADHGADAIVDWIFVELRDANDPTVVVATRSGLLQRDGDVVDIDGASALRFGNTGEGTYYVAIRHRNHLGVMTGVPVILTQQGRAVDFTNPHTD